MTPMQRLDELIAAERTQDLDETGKRRQWKRLAATATSAATTTTTLSAAGSIKLGVTSLLSRAALVKALSGTALVVTGTGAWVGTGMPGYDSVRDWASARTSATASETSEAKRHQGQLPSKDRAEAEEEPAPEEATQEPDAEHSPLNDDGASERAAKQRIPATPNKPSRATSGNRESLPRQDFDQELPLIRAANAAVDSGRSADALRYLSEHRRRFPAGIFQAERLGLEAIARCSAGQSSAGQRQARALLRRYPKSPLVDRVARACGLPDR